MDVDEDRRVVAAAAVLAIAAAVIVEEEERVKKRKMRSVLIKPWLLRRNEHGAFDTLLNECRREDRSSSNFYAWTLKHLTNFSQ